MRTLLVCAALAIGALAYDFHDPSYNQLLINDMEQLEDYLSKTQNNQFVNVRDRRSADSETESKEEKDKECSKKHKMKFCCGEEQFKELHSEKELEVKKECYLEVNGPNATIPHFLGGPKERDQKAPLDQLNPEKAKKWRGDITCVSECVAKRKKMINDKGEILEDEVRKWIELFFTEPYQKEILKTALPKCVSEANDKNVELPNFGHHNITQVPRPDGKVCTNSPLKFGFCIYREIQLNCPKDQIKSEEVCSKVLEKIKKRTMPLPTPEQ